MIFIGGITSKQEKLDFNQNIICSQCGRFGNYEVYMEYMQFSLFFIPIAKWNKKFFVRSTCCGSLYEISNDLGNRILKGENVNLSDEDLNLIYKGEESSINHCPQCGYEIMEDYIFCPKCGMPLKKQ